MRNKIASIFATIVASVLAITPVSAISNDTLDFYANNHIYFYNPSGNSLISCSSSLDERVLSTLITNGYSKIAAAGIYGNMMHEGLGASTLLAHENGTDDLSDIDTYYSDRIITENDVKNLDDPTVMHGLGLIQWSYERRVALLNALAARGLDQYARAWDDATGRYVYDTMTYTEMLSALGTETTNLILDVELDFFVKEHQSYTVSADDLAAQGLSHIAPGTSLKDALNTLSSPAAAAELFFSTSEMPNYTSFAGTPDDVQSSGRIASAEAGYNLASNLSCTNVGSSKLAETAINLAWPDKDHYRAVNPAFQDAVRKLGGASRNYCPNHKSGWSGSRELDYAQDCGVFVSVVVRASGIDPNFPVSGTMYEYEYMRSSNLWQEIANQHNTNNLLPGDIFVYNTGSEGHIYMYVGNGNIAHASLCNRTGNLTSIDWEGYTEYHNGGAYDYHIFRYIGA